MTLKNDAEAPNVEKEQAVVQEAEHGYKVSAFPVEKEGQSVVEHLQDLRSCLIKSLLALVVGIIVCFAFIEPLIALLTAGAGELYYMRPAEAFMIYLKVAIICGALLASPVLLYELYVFIRPALTDKELKYTRLLLPLLPLLFVAGMTFAYFYVFPSALSFFLGFAQGKVAPLLSLESYLEFMLLLVVPCGLAFDLPLYLLALGAVGLISSAKLASWRRQAIFLFFLLAAFITPTPDIITQSMLALPMVALYELSIWLLRLLLRA